MNRQIDDESPPAAPPQVVVITCAVLEAEIEHFARDLSHIRHVEILQQGLHNEPDRLRSELQAAIDRVEARDGPLDAIVLGYGLCSRGIEGVRTQRAKLVIARAHDCITILLGSKQRYAQYVQENPGTYWYSIGWNKHHTPPGKDRYEKLYQQYCEKYGQDNAEYLMEQEQHWFRTYDRATFVELSIGRTDLTAEKQYTQSCAQWLDWSYDHQVGDPRLLSELLSGPWRDEDFLVLEPGQTIRMTADDRIVEADDGQDAGAQQT